MYGTNPLAVAFPTSDEDPFVFDAATSVVPRGRLERIQRQNGRIPHGWAINPDGDSTADLEPITVGLKQRDGHALLPLGGADEMYGGHKGYGLGLIVELLCGPLAGAAWGRHVYGTAGAGLGHFILCGRVEDLVPLAAFRAECASMFGELRTARRSEGAEAVRIPGDRRRDTRAEREANGVPLPDMVIDDLAQIGRDCGVATPGSFARKMPA